MRGCVATLRGRGGTPAARPFFAGPWTAFRLLEPPGGAAGAGQTFVVEGIQALVALVAAP